jgi:glycosyl transferase family 87
MPLSSRRLWAGLTLAVLLLSAMISFSSPLGLDYYAPPCDPYICDDAGPALHALVHGDLHGFFANQPPMGSFSLYVRAPFAALAGGGHGSELLVYRLGALACLLAAGALSLYLVRALARRGRSWTTCVVGLGVLVNPLTYSALKYGHPEEVLGGALCVAALLAAARRRPLAAGILLGCAIATKQWAALAVLPVLIAAPRGARVRLVGVAAIAAVALMLPMVIGDPGRFADAQRAIGISKPFQHTVTASNVWFQFADGSTQQGVTQYSLPGWLGALTTPLVIAVAFALSLAYVRRRGGAEPEAALGLLALILLLRCLLDPLAYSYHHVPFLMALVAWEALRRRVPVLSVLAAGALVLTTNVVAPLHDASLVNAFYLAWAMPLAVALGLLVLAPDRAALLARRLRGGVAARAPQGA